MKIIKKWLQNCLMAIYVFFLKKAVLKTEQDHQSPVPTSPTTSDDGNDKEVPKTLNDWNNKDWNPDQQILI